MKAAENLYLYSKEYKDGADKFVREMGASSTEIAEIGDMPALEKVTSSFTNVKFLVFDTHGESGKIQLDDGTKAIGMDIGMAIKNASLLQMDSRVLFYGCNIAEGAAGDTFLTDIGQYLFFGKGGTVGATTVLNMTVSIGHWINEPVLNPFASGQLKVKRFDTRGKEVAAKTVTTRGWIPW